MSRADSFTPQQQAALDYMRVEGEATEGGLWYEGLNHPRLTLLSLERRGLVLRREYIDEEWGLRWELATTPPEHVSAEAT